VPVVATALSPHISPKSFAKARAAVSLEKATQVTPVCGALWRPV
jgi:hypothetical protein